MELPPAFALPPMKNFQRRWRTAGLLALFLLSTPAQSALAADAVRPLAFPTAEGYGRFAQGGRGGRVIAVTNLADRGPGTLRAAVAAEGPRTVVFHVSGLITLESKLVIWKTNSLLTSRARPRQGKASASASSTSA